MAVESEPVTQPIRVVIVDDHPIVREGLIQLIDAEDDLRVVGEAEDAHAAMDEIQKVQPDIAIVDISLKGINGVELIKNLKIRHPRLPVLVLSMHDEALYAERALRAGARGYIMKQEATERVMEAIRRVMRGEIHLSEKIASRMLHKIVDAGAQAVQSPIELLSDRELEVFQLIGRGVGTREIAEELHLSIKTVESHRANIKKKLQLKTATELMRYALQWVQGEE